MHFILWMSYFFDEIPPKKGDYLHIKYHFAMYFFIYRFITFGPFKIIFYASHRDGT